MATCVSLLTYKNLYLQLKYRVITFYVELRHFIFLIPVEVMLGSNVQKHQNGIRNVIVFSSKYSSDIRKYLLLFTYGHVS